MTKRQLLSRLKKSGKIYHNLDTYIPYLKKASEIKINVGQIKNIENMAKIFNDKLANEGVDLVNFDNILINLRGIQIPHFLSGEIEKHNVLLHLLPAPFESEKHTIYTTLVHDWRFYGKAQISHSHLSFSDARGLHLMSMVDEAADSAGCKCYRQNPFNINDDFVEVLDDMCPGFGLDQGFALPGCQVKQPGCSALKMHEEPTKLMICVALAYISMPCNYLLRVDTVRKGKPNKSLRYYICVDKGQIEKLMAGNTNAELRGNILNKVTNFEEILDQPKEDLEIDKFSIKNKEYTIL